MLDAQGEPTRDPDALFEGGMLLPFGTYKGYGLNLLMALIPVLLAGTPPSGAAGVELHGNPTLMIALSIEAFGGLERFTRLADELRERAHEIRPMPTGTRRCYCPASRRSGSWRSACAMASRCRSQPGTSCKPLRRSGVWRR